MERDFKACIKYAEDNPDVDYAIVVGRTEIVALREKYDKKYTLKVNKLQNVDVYQGRGLLQGVKLAWGEWND